MIEISISSKWFNNCDGYQIQQLNRLRFKKCNGSMMYEDVIAQPSIESRKRIRIFLAKDGYHIVGWSALLLPPTSPSTESIFYPIPYKSTKAPIYTYVNKKCRRGNIGKRLIKAACTFSIKQEYTPVVFFYNEKSSSFFAEVNKECDELEVYDMSEWWDLFSFAEAPLVIV